MPPLAEDSIGERRMVDRRWMMLILWFVLAGVRFGQPFAANLTQEKSVVMIQSFRQDYDHVTPWKKRAMSPSVGSGFVIGGNRILTNAHNVSNNKYVEIKKQNLAKRYPAEVAYIGHDCDLAILTVQEAGFFDDMVALELGEIPAAHSTVQTYGFPIGGQHVSVTEGVVSRVQMDLYVHSMADSHLVIQTDAAINPGNSGGPVVQDGRVVGVAFQGLAAAENIGYMIPTTVIRHFLKDISDGLYDGFGSIGFSFFPGLHNEGYRDYLKVPAGTDGVVVTGIIKGSSLEGVVEAGDVLTQVANLDIDNDGMIEIYGLRLHLSEAVEQRQLGEKLEMVLYRGGERMVVTAEVALNRPVLAYWREYDIRPRYYVYGGLTFVPLSRNYLEAWGKSWMADIPFYLRYLFHNSRQLNTQRDRKEYVVLSTILSDEVNSYAAPFEDQVVESINGVEVMSMDDLPGALAGSKNGFCEISFMGNSTPLVLDRSAVNLRESGILGKYQVPERTNLEK